MEEVPTFVWREEIADFADGLDELIEGPGSNPEQMGLQLRESHLDRVEIRTAGRQEEEIAPMGLSIRVAVSLLWVARLSRMTTDPGSSSGIGTFSMQLSKASRSRAPEITRGATIPSQDRPAIKVRFAPPSRRRGAQQKHLARRRSAQPPVHQIPETDPKVHRKRIPHGTSFHRG